MQPVSYTHLDVYKRQAQGLRPKIRHRTASYEVVRTLVARGLGYGILVSRVANPGSYEGLPLVEKTIAPPVRPVACLLYTSRCV